MCRHKLILQCLFQRLSWFESNHFGFQFIFERLKILLLTLVVMAVIHHHHHHQCQHLHRGPLG
jgi:hypothetical protein